MKEKKRRRLSAAVSFMLVIAVFFGFLQGKATDDERPDWIAVSQADWQVYWQVSAVHGYEGVLTEPAAGADGTVYVGGFTSPRGHDRWYYLAAYDPAGGLKWRLELEDEPDANPPVAAGGMIFVLLKNHRLLGISPNGELKWSREGVLAVVAFDNQPATHEAAVLALSVAHGMHRLEALDANGKTLWSFADETFRLATWERASSRAVLAYTGQRTLWGKGGAFFVLDQEGNRPWSKSLSGVAVTAAVLDKNGDVYVGTDDQRILAYARDGSIKWEADVRGLVVGQPAVNRDGFLFAATNEGFIYAFSPDGTLLWNHGMKDGRFLSGVVLAAEEEAVYVTATPRESGMRQNGKFAPGKWLAFSPEGRLLWSLDLWREGTVSRPVRAHGGLHFVATIDRDRPAGSLFAIGKPLPYAPFALNEQAIRAFADGQFAGLPFAGTENFPYEKVVESWGEADKMNVREDIHDYYYVWENETIGFTVDETGDVYDIQVQLHGMDITEVIRRLGLPDKGNWLNQKLAIYRFGDHDLRVRALPQGVQLRLVLSP